MAVVCGFFFCVFFFLHIRIGPVKNSIAAGDFYTDLAASTSKWRPRVFKSSDEISHARRETRRRARADPDRDFGGETRLAFYVLLLLLLL